MYSRSGFRAGGTSAKTTLLETTPFRQPQIDHLQVVSVSDMVALVL